MRHALSPTNVADVNTEAMFSDEHSDDLHSEKDAPGKKFRMNHAYGRARKSRKAQLAAARSERQGKVVCLAAESRASLATLTAGGMNGSDGDATMIGAPTVKCRSQLKMEMMMSVEKKITAVTGAFDSVVL